MEFDLLQKQIPVRRGGLISYKDSSPVKTETYVYKYDDYLKKDKSTGKKIVSFLISTHSHLAVFAMLLSAAWQYYVANKVSILLTVSMAVFTWVIYGINQMTDKKEDFINNIDKMNFSEKYAKPMLYIFAAAAVLCLGLTYSQKSAFYVELSGVALGILYSLKVIPGIKNGKLNFYKIKELSFLKTFFTSFVLSYIIILPALFHNTALKPEILFMAAIFLKTAADGALFCDIRDLTGDKVAGIGTIPVKIGIKKTVSNIIYGNLFFALLSTMLMFKGIISPATFMFGSLVLVYSSIFAINAKNLRKNWNSFTILCEGYFPLCSIPVFFI
ncbi:MAG: UbiA family prenyltransferase [Fibrobacterota bacterium]